MNSDTYPDVAVLCAMYIRDRIHLVEKSVRSIIEQDYPRERIKIYLYVDGPVSTAHNSFLTTHGDWFYRVIRGEKNIGLPGGLNTLLRALEDEEFIFRMDVDDLADPKRFRQQLEFMRTHPEIDLCGCNSHEINDDDGVIFTRNYPETHKEIVHRLPRCNPMLHPTYCIRAATWRRQTLYYQTLHLNEDLGFIFDAVNQGWKLHNLQERLFFWRTGMDFHNRRNHRRAVVELRTYMHGIRQLWGISPKLLWPIARYLFRLLPSWMSRSIYRTTVRNQVLG